MTSRAIGCTGVVKCKERQFEPNSILTSCRRFAAHQARLLMGVLAYNLLHMLRQFYLHGEEVKRSKEWLIKRLIKVGANVAYHAGRWHVHVASGFLQSRGHGKLFRYSVV